LFAVAEEVGKGWADLHTRPAARAARRWHTTMPLFRWPLPRDSRGTLIRDAHQVEVGTLMFDVPAMLTEVCRSRGPPNRMLICRSGRFCCRKAEVAAGPRDDLLLMPSRQP
jgi:hypothetical protein